MLTQDQLQQLSEARLKRMQQSNQDQDQSRNKDQDQNRDQNTDQNQVNQQLQALKAQHETLLSDPDVLRVLRAKERGVDPWESEQKADKGKDEGEDFLVSESPKLDFGDADLNDLDNKALAETVARAVQQSLVKDLGKSVKKEISTLRETLGPVQEYISESQKMQLRGQIEAARKKYDDFDDYQTQMVKLNQENPSLSVEDLYILAKTRSGKSISSQDQRQVDETSSERPTRDTTSVPRGRRNVQERAKDNNETKVPMRGPGHLRSLIQDTVRNME